MVDIFKFVVWLFVALVVLTLIASALVEPIETIANAFAELRALLTAREPLYSAADHIVDTSGRNVEEVISAITRTIGN